jgi:hypothetical protein
MASTQRWWKVAETDDSSLDDQTKLVMAALAIAFAKTLQELLPSEEEEVLVILQRKAKVEQTRLRQTPGAERAVRMFRFVIDALRNPDVIEQPED